jgi:flagellar hook-associated protein 3 FlgL
MRVTFNSFPDTLLSRLQSLGADQNKALVQLSTGQRISAPSDDAPAMQRVLTLRAEKKQNQQFYRNATDGKEINETSIATLDHLSQLLTRAAELASNVSGTTSEQDFKAKYSEINQLVEQGVNAANTKLRGSYLFAGDASGAATAPFDASRNPGSNVIESISYKGSETSAEMNIGEATKISAYTSPEENEEIAVMLNKLVELRDAMGAQDASQVLTVKRDLIDGDGNLEDKMLSMMSRAGSIQYRLEVAMNDLEVRYNSSEELIATDADIDFAEATVRLNRAQMAYEAAVQSGARIQSVSLLDYVR